MSTVKRPSAVTGLEKGLRPAPALPVAAVTAGPASRPTPPRPPKDVRFTLDLTEDLHAFLKRFAEESGAGVRASQVMRALLEELREGANLPVRVRARIWAAKR